VIDELHRQRLRRVIRDFFRDKPPGTTIEQRDLDEYHRRLQEAGSASDVASGANSRFHGSLTK
jgi:hypothetical protein